MSNNIGTVNMTLCLWDRTLYSHKKCFKAFFRKMGKGSRNAHVESIYHLSPNCSKQWTSLTLFNHYNSMLQVQGVLHVTYKETD